ncbi:MAG: ATP-binding cassette domain-containing protein [Calditrichaeota bacterium]|nr:ATP-binding cassette domain-containing protein [Calditrichota bacterium]
MVKLLNVTYRYNGGSNGLSGVFGITLDIAPGEFVMLVGKTGAGKTTLFRLISLELVPTSGEIMLDIFKSSELKRSRLPQWRRRLGIVHQNFRLLDDRSVLDNVRLAASCEKSLPARPKKRSLRALAGVGLTHKLHSNPRELSTGEQQRTALARAIVNEPFLLLADEPVSNLDVETSGEIIELLKKVNRAGTAILVATHQPERFSSCNPRVLQLETGKLV